LQNLFAREYVIMSRISAAIAVLMLIGATSFGVAPASADSWGCSYDKCLAACAKSGGKYCSTFCSKSIADKQASKVCK
jgi:hypothetical protein